MKVETPQILWHNGSEGNGKPAPLYSVSLLPTSTHAKDSDILATAGNTNEVHIWNITFPPVKQSVVVPHQTSSTEDPVTLSPRQGQNKRRKILASSISIIKHITTITRHQSSVNAVAFSPHGNHLATAGDKGSFIIHTLPFPYRRSEVTRNHFWKKKFTTEKDLNIKVMNTHAQDIMDLSWSSDERRIILGSLDHSVFVFEECNNNTPRPTTSGVELEDMANRSDMGRSQSEWKCVWRNTKEHTHYVQGVAFDPLGVYFASQGSDRSVRVWQRKRGSKKNASKKKVLATMDGNANDNALSENTNHSSSNRNTTTTTTTTSSDQLFTGKFEVGKAKMVKYRSLERDGANANGNTDNTKASNNNSTAPRKRHLFADESSVESFFRRLAWTQDGAFLITPASLWHSNGVSDAKVGSSTPSSPSFATYLFARHQYEQPFKVLFGLEKPSVVIRPNPLLFQLPKDAQSCAKENLRQKPFSMSNNMNGNIPYRSIFAVLTIDSILIYDTYHSRPLCVARGLHYAGLTDCTWSSDGKNLIVCSTDGYISILSFAEGELGEVYLTQSSTINSTRTASNVEAKEVDVIDRQILNPLQNRRRQHKTSIPNTSTLPPCEPGQSATLVAPPAKRARFDKGEKKRVAPILMSVTTCSNESKEQNAESMEIQQADKGNGNCMENDVVGAVTNLSLNNELQGKMNHIGSVC